MERTAMMPTDTCTDGRKTLSTSQQIKLPSGSAGIMISSQNPLKMNPTKQPPSLNTIPLEIRHKIYKYLLMNPVLGKLESIIGESISLDGYESVIKYNLYPVILRVCKQNYKEGCDILYSQGIIVCFNRVLPLLNYWSPVSPLFRYSDRRYRVCSDDIEMDKTSQAINKVQKWKMVVSSYKNIHWERQKWGFDVFPYFCNCLCNIPIKEIEVILWDINTQSRHQLMEPEFTLRPLTVLRNIGNLTIREAAVGEFPYPKNIEVLHDRNTSSEVSSGKSNMPDQRLYEKIKNMVEGDTPVEHLSEMHMYLLKFARSFENFAPWKGEMGAFAEDSQPFTIHRYKSTRHNKNWLYPYTDSHTSYLEGALRDAYTASQDMDSTEFKSLRAGIVKHLQPQYDRIVSASRLLVTCINNEKVKNGALDPCPTSTFDDENFDPIRIAELVGLVEEYAATFEREKDPITKAQFRLSKRKLDNMRMYEPREMKLQRLGRILEDQRFDLFKSAFRELVDDLETEFLEIRETWGDLFKGDRRQDIMCDIQYDSRCLDGMIDLTVREPDMQVARGSIYRGFR